MHYDNEPKLKAGRRARSNRTEKLVERAVARDPPSTYHVPPWSPLQHTHPHPAPPPATLQALHGTAPCPCLCTFFAELHLAHGRSPFSRSDILFCSIAHTCMNVCCPPSSTVAARRFRTLQRQSPYMSQIRERRESRKMQTALIQQRIASTNVSPAVSPTSRHLLHIVNHLRARASCAQFTAVVVPDGAYSLLALCQRLSRAFTESLEPGDVLRSGLDRAQVLAELAKGIVEESWQVERWFGRPKSL
ncbi:hypothetical protein C8Q73DRAFT_685403 [Cubamyces lactineus]|nr:hypothetical protein C8Q73DRAFT_685403 [Cubamyces lactineus]